MNEKLTQVLKDVINEREFFVNIAVVIQKHVQVHVAILFISIYLERKGETERGRSI
jgi:hypothetical protein